MMEVLLFLMIIEVIGFISFPIVAFLFKSSNLGYSFSKQFGVVIVVYTVWILSSFRLLELDNSIIFAVSLLFMLSLLTLKHSYVNIKLNNIKLNIILQEIIFISAYLVLIGYLMFKPEIYFAYSEDFMDFAFLNSILKTNYLPPRDPWFAGANLSYYYFGHLISAILIKISGVKAEIGYNLAVATFFSMSVQSAFGIGYNLTKNKKKLHGLLTVILIFTGFTSGFLQLLAYLIRMNILDYKPFNGGFIDWLLSFDFSSATRTIPNTINFYPLFTFLQGDMHAHLMSIPFQLAFIGICLAIYKRLDVTSLISSLIFVLFFIGLNAWDFPAYFILLFLLAYLKTKNRIFLIPIAVIAVIFLYAILNNYIGFVNNRTDIVSFFQLFATFTFITFAYIYYANSSKVRLGIIILLLIIALVGFLLNFHLAFLLALPISLLQRAKKEDEFPIILVILAMTLLIFCELFYINDPFGKPYERMNTVMKIHLEVWILWGVASAFFLIRLKKIAKIISIILIISSLIHPLASAISMPNKDYMGKTRELTLNGIKWLEEERIYEYKAIEWLKNKSGVVLEAPGVDYSYTSRVSAFTGLPTIIGWPAHEVMWSRKWDEVNERIRDVDLMYTKPSKKLMERYGVKYIFIGEVERERYGEIKLSKFRDYGWLKKVYDNGRVIIYEVEVNKNLN